MVSSFSRFLYIESLLSYSEDHLYDRIAAISDCHSLSPSRILTDQQSADKTT